MPYAGTEKRLRDIPSEVLDELEGDAELWDGEQGLDVELYNGSTWEVRELVVVFDAAFEDGTEMHRLLAVPCELQPLAVGTAWCPVGFSWSERPVKNWDWSIRSGRGIPP